MTKKEPITKVRPVYLVWMDCNSDNDWMDRIGITDLPLGRIEVLAWCLHEDEETIKISPCIDTTNHTAGDVWAIPKKLVTEIKFLPDTIRRGAKPIGK